MGNCCGADKQQGEITLHRGNATRSGNEYFDDRVVAGLSGKDKEQLLVKLQANMRGFITRKHVKQMYGF